MINVYDFDKTIYSGDSSVDFYKYCIKLKPYLLMYLPVQVFYIALNKLHLVSKEKCKSKFFIFLKRFRNIDNVVKNFWDKNEYNIQKWYLDQKQNSDLIISASPEFLLKEITKRLNISLIASNVDKNTGKFIGKNCKGEEKVNRFNKEYKNKKIDNFYSDSMSDIYLGSIANNFYIVSGTDIKKYNK